jgi:serine/threonine-protein kinase
VSAALGPERFLREIQIAARLQHPHIVALFDSGESDGVLYYVMPYVEGQTLRARLRREPQLPLDEAIAIARDVAEALDYAHAAGIVHRDIKPENIMLSGGHALVADFGVARAISRAADQSRTDTGMAVGTPAYMSPEQAGGAEEVDGRADVYALGCVLYEMLAGEPPFTGASAQAVIARHLSQDPPSVRVLRGLVPEAVERAIRRALQKTPVDRFSSAAEFSRALVAPRRAPWSVPAAAASVVAVGGLAAAALISRLGGGEGGSGVGAPPDLHDLAVLYFNDRSGDSSLEWLARGLTEDLIDRLADGEGLSVVSRSGVRPYQASEAAPDSIGRALGVGLIIDGSVERGPDEVRVTVRMVDPVSARQLEHFTIHRPPGEPIGLREDIIVELERRLRERIGARITLSQERRGTRNDEAWAAVQEAGALESDVTLLVDLGGVDAALERLRRADSLLARAEVLDPDWVLPVVKRGELSWSMAQTALSGPLSGTAPPDAPSVNAILEVGLAHLDRAVRKAPEDAYALTQRGLLATRLWNFGEVDGRDTLLESAYQDARRATELEPSSAVGWYVLSEVESLRGRNAEARVAAQRALDSDIYAEQAPRALAQLYFDALERTDEAGARRYCEEGRRRFPEVHNFRECELTLLAWFGRGQGAVRDAWRLIQALDTARLLAHGRLHRRLYAAAVLARTGLADSARRVIATTRALASDEAQVGDLRPIEAYIWVLLGDLTTAADRLAPILAADSGAARYWLHHPWFAPVANAPEFRRLQP